MQLTLSSFMIITSYLVTTLLVSCVLVNGSVSWYSGQQARNCEQRRWGLPWCPPSRPGSLLECSCEVHGSNSASCTGSLSRKPGRTAAHGGIPTCSPICQAPQSLFPTVQVEVGYRQPQTHLNLQLLPSVFSLPLLPRSPMKMF